MEMAMLDIRRQRIGAGSYIGLQVSIVLAARYGSPYVYDASW